MHSYRPVLAVLLALSAAPLPAHTVSFIVGETGLSREAPSSDASNRWETGLMDAFFDAGHIVSNAPILRLGSPAREELPPEFMRDFYDAREGGVEFLILALLDYRAWDGRGPLEPRRVSLRVFRVTPYQFVVEEQFPLPGRIPDPDILVNARQAGRMLLAHLKD
ncbi:MAG: hypothetical protein LBQ35_08735 [Spirochaetaceae bacterium]|jgi:hypothetical protein|nr:hypothetical protein [Spirochaetaceae bacterium]